MSTQWDSIQDLGAGIFVYKNVVKKELDIINRLEGVVSPLGSEGQFSWQPAYVGYQELMPEYRDCTDFKFKKKDIESIKTEESLALQQIWQDVYDVEKLAIDDYCKKHDIMELRYWEAFNFVKYTKGQHFSYHHDHGYSYNCTVSTIAYLNDDFVGGGLHFRSQDIYYTPSAGDLIVFPSTYMYPHAGLPVESGTKYIIVTMLDYSDKFHDPKFYSETGR